jgi:hypothetical protein
MIGGNRLPPIMHSLYAVTCGDAVIMHDLYAD